MSTFTAPAILTRIAFLKDGGVSLGFSTNELSDEDKITASKFFQKFGWVLFKESQFTDEEIPKGHASDDSKTPSQRLRAVLFVYWTQLGKQGDFDSFYRAQMDSIIDKVKSKLD